jgi:hypothetical protein
VICYNQEKKMVGHLQKLLQKKEENPKKKKTRKFHKKKMVGDYW